MLRWFSKKEEVLFPLDFSVLKTDIHSHFIPGIDDGSSNMQTTVELISKMKELGYTKVITTPHVMSDMYKNSSEEILAGLSDVRAALREQNINIKVDASAEYYIDFEFQEKIEKTKFLTFGDSYILIELPFSQAPNLLSETIFRLQLEGYQVVLAHPERYGYYTKQNYNELTDRGVLFQINLLSLIGYYSNSIKKRAEHLISNKQVSFVGTDCHNMTHANLYSKCQTKRAWHDLVSSGRLLNDRL